MIHNQRIKVLNTRTRQRRHYVLYWMQALQRCESNHALEYAILQANERNQPLMVFFGVTDDFPEADARYYTFMLQGLKETQAELRDRNVQMVTPMLTM